MEDVLNVYTRPYDADHPLVCMAETELSVLGRQCLSRRTPDQQTLRREVATWETERNTKGSTVGWRFTTEDARIRLKKLYPSFGV
jgi:hypothetical protein